MADKTPWSHEQRLDYYTAYVAKWLLWLFGIALSLGFVIVGIMAVASIFRPKTISNVTIPMMKDALEILRLVGSIFSPLLAFVLGYYFNLSNKTANTLSQTPSINLSAQAADGQVTLNWTPLPGAQTYNIYRGTATGGESMIKSGLTGTTYTDTGLTNGTTYYYKVTAITPVGETFPSNEVSVTPQAGTPSSATPFQISGPASVQHGTTSNYQVTTTGTPQPVTWSVEPPTVGRIATDPADPTRAVYTAPDLAPAPPNNTVSIVVASATNPSIRRELPVTIT